MKREPQTPRARPKRLQRGVLENIASLILQIATVAMLAVVAASFFLVMFFKNIIARAFLAGLIAAGWIALYVTQVQRPVRAIQDKMQHLQTAQNACAAQARSLPEWVDVEDGVVLAGLSTEAILQILVERRLPSIDLKILGSGADEGYIGVPIGDRMPPWKTSHRPGQIVRLSLSRHGDPSCISTAELAFGYEHTLAQPPFLPDTCIAAEYFDKSEARLAIVYAAGVKELGPDFGSLQLMDRRSNTALASLTTPHQYEGAWRLTGPKQSRKDDCMSPYGVLVDRLRAPQGTPLSRQLVAEETVQASVDLSTLTADTSLTRDVDVVETVAKLSDHEVDDRIHRYIGKEGWARAVEEAKSSRWGNYSDRLLDWNGRRLISLQPPGESRSPRTVFHALNGGFLAHLDNSWSPESRNVVAFFDSDGLLRWALRLHVPSDSQASKGCPYSPEGASMSERGIVLHRTCAKLPLEETQATGKSTSGVDWLIPLATVQKN